MIPIAIAAIVVAALAIGVILLAGPGATPGATVGPSGSSPAEGGDAPSTSPGAGGATSSSEASPSDDTGASPDASEPDAIGTDASSAPSDGPIAAVPIVPVVDFRSTETTVKSTDVRAALTGTDGTLPSRSFRLMPTRSWPG